MLKNYEGSPKDPAGRSAKELAAYELLDSLGIAYTRVDHAPAMTMEDCLEIDAALGASMCKNLFLCNRQCTDFYLLLLPGDKPFRTKALSAQLGVARLSFGSGEKMEELLGVLPGAATAMGLAFDKTCRVQVLIDRELLSGERIGMHPMVNTASVAITVTDLLEKLLPATSHTPIFVELSRELE